MDNIIRENAENARPFIEAALEHSGGSHNFEDIVDGILSGEMQLWATDKAALVTEIHLCPRKTRFHVFLAGGDLTEIRRLAPILTEWAKGQGCQQITLTGRKGWERSFLQQDGFSTLQYTLFKDI